MGYLKVLRIPHLAVLWGSQVLSAIGDHLFGIAIMWIAVKQVGSSAGVVIAAGSLSALLSGLFGGVFADRWNRRLTMIGVDVVRALFVGLLPVFVFVGSLQLWHLIVITVVVEVLGTLFDPALQASLPMLVGGGKTLSAANALMDATHRLARVLGPGMAGVLLLLLPLAHFFTLDAISFSISALALFSLGSRHTWKPAPPSGRVSRRGNVVADILGAIQLVREHHALTWALVSLGIVNLAWSAAFTVGVPLLTSRILVGNAGAYGLIVGAYGAGNVIESLFVGSLVVRGRRLRMMFLGEIVLGAGFLVLASASNLGIALLGSMIAAFGSPMGDLMLLTMIQEDFPPEHIGKIYSLRMTIGGMGLTLGMLLAVPLFNFFSIPVAIALCAFLIVLVGAVGLVRFRTI